MCSSDLCRESRAGRSRSRSGNRKKNARTQRIVEAIRCREAEPALSDGELFARAMQDYWQREMHGLWGKDESLNHNYPGANGNIHVTDSDCGLIRDTAGQPLHIERDTCYPFRLDKYNTLDRLTERLKAVPEFGAKHGFDQPGRHAGGWIYDAIVGELLSSPKKPTRKPNPSATAQ